MAGNNGNGKLKGYFMIVTIEGKEITVSTEPDGAIVPTHIDGRLINYRSDDPDSDFIELYHDEIVKAVEDLIEADEYEQQISDYE